MTRVKITTGGLRCHYPLDREGGRAYLMSREVYMSPLLSAKPRVGETRETLGRRYGDVEEIPGRRCDVEINNWRGIVLGMIHDEYAIKSSHFSYEVCSCPAAKIARFQELGIRFSHWTRLENWI